MRSLRVILGDQLSHSISSLKGIDIENDTVLMCEVWDEATYVKHHKKKIAFLFSAMRHFAEELKILGYSVSYTKLTDSDNQGSFKEEVRRALCSSNYDQIVITFPGEYRVLKDIQTWSSEFGINVSILEDDRFLCPLDEFNQWAANRKQLVMEYFYRAMRQKYQILLIDNKPIGDKWNFDTDNRKVPSPSIKIPNKTIFEPDLITQEVISLVDARFSKHFGSLDSFHFAVTRKDALGVLNEFITQRLSQFGDYQDAMIEGEPWLFHSHISFYLNCGLLLPKECINAALEAYHLGFAALHSVEGFIRQILGWREYIRGIYWLYMPEYAEANFFKSTRKLPDFYWSANTSMNCLHQCIKETQQNAYAHHIQRLMVLGNFALLAGIDPKDVNEWFLIVYADAYEWVELPNVTGMILFADGGIVGSKPYAAGGSYINKMSNYCKRCQYNVKLKTGKDACPFNYLYWNFLMINESKLKHNHRLSMIYSTLNKMDDNAKSLIKESSVNFLDNLISY
ncbi:cryptochrome/photolyase family protein [Thorsellia anophelis]|uniref:Deoxyribodipyrimidine photolyase-related protein n=1 Tax=Thorsellia anophelis DSM 18579 TaxID=1123402 RepID=A0A1I0CU29_9GAMM|nr:cryptochrome/photolyase family protein [Thorsellia anophelis]SET22604.1 deoxyribodipyrimidine photolyase-related protein [Thorsellia anophelis DSM 18579]